MVISLQNIHKSFGVTEILNNITFHIETGDKLGLVGVNGAGKTTLFKIITGELSKDAGEVHFAKDVKPSYMSQISNFNENNNVYDEFLTVFEDIINLEKDIATLFEEMAIMNGEELEQAMKKYSRLNEEFEFKNGYEYKSRVNGVINGLGFRDYGDRAVSSFSGGEKTRVALGKLLLSNPKLLLLDEPTNHLDIESIAWLEDYLKSFSGTIIIISHDRYFLDKITNKTVEIENKKAKLYNGNYSAFTKKKEENRQIQLKHFLDQQKVIKKQEESIAQLKEFGSIKSMKRAFSKEKQLDKVERVDKPENLPQKMRINLTPKAVSGNDVLIVKDLSKSFDDKLLFKNINFEIKRGDRIALIGPNGIGKTTLFRMITNQIDFTGIIDIGAKVDIGYYDQTQKNLNPENTIFEEIHNAYPTLKSGEIRNILAAFVFRGDDVYKKISSLSGGEMGRVSLAKIILKGANFLILDEPTNHLDMYSKEILEEAINNFEGTAFFISHDRYFINSCATKVLELTPDGCVVYYGDYDYYLEKKKNPDTFLEASKETSTRETWLKKKEEEALERKSKNRLKNINKEIENLETKLEEVNKELESSELQADYEKLAKYHEIKEKTEEELLGLYAELEELEKVQI
ncbi:MAG: ABC-F family ATP-binding cassette domain-containing protein [Defluviitaleaceae bacterium]|nr:ABC-F family ATP-binding cassette domain-containing protein [Defluviitaleaceae bacterium]